MCSGIEWRGCALLLAAAAACAAVPALAVRGAADGGGRGATAYIEGRLASQEQDLGLAAERFADALKQAPGDSILRRRALEVAILSGDRNAAFYHADALQSARRAAGEAPVGAGDALVALTTIAAAATAQSWRGVEAARAGFVEPRPRGDSEPVMGAIIDAWTAAARGDMARALALTEVEGAAGISRSYLTEHRAHLLAVARRWPEAAEAYAAMVAGEATNVPRLRIAAAAAAVEAARIQPDRASYWREQAVTLLGGGPAQEPLLADARARFAADPALGGRALGGPALRPADGIALLMLRVASDLGRNRPDGSALHFARLGSFISPRLAESWVLVAELLVRQDRADLALAALDQAPDSGPWGRIVAARRAGALGAMARWDEARAILTAEAARPDAGADALVRLAQLERDAGQPRVAAAAYARAIAAAEAGGMTEGPALAQLWFLAGVSHHDAGDWPAAEAALRRAAALVPDNPIVLNFLGYSLLDRGEDLAEARTLIARAYAKAPDNGAIIDSMGWAAFVAGDHAEAVRLLEQARAAEPADPTVADHLGDAYWKVGRRIEARHLWQSARALSPDKALDAKLAAKLDIGLDAALAAK